MQNREDIYKNLATFYEDNGLSPKGFQCKHADKCATLIGARGFAGRGQQLHLGQKYGDGAKVVVLSLDIGSGVATNMAVRTQDIENLDLSDLNPHMKGTKELLISLFKDQVKEEEQKEIFQHFAMTNSCKCSGIGSMDKLPTDVYINCKPYQLEEIKLLQPDIIYAEGKDSIPWHSDVNYSTPSETISRYVKGLSLGHDLIQVQIEKILTKYVQKMTLNEFVCFFIACPHPSSRGGQWQVFCNLHLPILNDFIRKQVGGPLVSAGNV